jgi:hypothetical protein
MGAEESKPSGVSDEAWLNYQREKLQYRREEKERQREVEREQRVREKEEQDRISAENQLKAKQMAVHFAEYMHHCHDCPRWMMIFPGNRERCANARLGLLNSGVDLAFNDTKIQDDMVQMVKNMK